MPPNMNQFKLRFTALMVQIAEALDDRLGKTATAVAATKLETERTIAITGDGTWEVTFDGTDSVSGVLALVNTGVVAGQYTKVTVDSKGRVTGTASLIATDIPALPISKITGLTGELENKVNNGDARLSDAREWTSATVGQAEAEGRSATTRRAWTAQRIRQAITGWWNSSAEKTKLDGIQAGAQVNIATNLSYTSAPGNGTVVSSTGSNAVIPSATTAAAGLLTAADKVKLDGIVAGATANSSDSTLLARANHTGTQAISTVSGLQAALDAKFNTSGGTVSGQTVFSHTANATSATTGAIRTNGGLGVALDIYAGGNVTAYSDIRKKTNIEVIKNPLEKLHQVRGATYDRLDTGRREAGMIAQEWQRVLPEVVMGNEDGLSLAYGNSMALVVEAVKELHGLHCEEVRQRDQVIYNLKAELEQVKTLINQELNDGL